MSIINIISPPLQEDKFSSSWIVWLVELKNSISKLTSFSWSLIDFTSSNITDILTRNHNDLQNKQGGTTNEYYHLTSAQHLDLIDGGDTTLHKHLDSFGEMYFSHTTVTVTVSVAGTAYEIASGFTQGILQNVSFGGNHYLSVSNPGKYIVVWSLSVDTTTALDVAEGGVMVNGTETGKGTCHTTVPAGGISGTMILDLATNDQVSLYVKNHTAARNVSIEHASITIRKLIT